MTEVTQQQQQQQQHGCELEGTGLGSTEAGEATALIYALTYS